MMPRRPVAQRARAEIADRTAVVSVPRSTEGRSVARARTFDGRESTSADESDTDARVNERPGARARKQLEARGVSIPSLPPTDVRAIRLRPKRELLLRAYCHVAVAQYASGMGRELSILKFEQHGLFDALNEEERKFWDVGAEDGLAVPGAIPLGYAQEAGLTLMWVLGMTDTVPALMDDHHAALDAEGLLCADLLDPIEPVHRRADLLTPRDAATLAAEIDDLAAYEAVYAREHPRWVFGGSNQWVPPLGPEVVHFRLRTLRWACMIDA
jgi:hypothetical protein